MLMICIRFLSRLVFEDTVLLETVSKKETVLTWLDLLANTLKIWQFISAKFLVSLQLRLSHDLHTSSFLVRDLQPDNRPERDDSCDNEDLDAKIDPNGVILRYFPR